MDGKSQGGGIRKEEGTFGLSEPTGDLLQLGQEISYNLGHGGRAGGGGVGIRLPC